MTDNELPPKLRMDRRMENSIFEEKKKNNFKAIIENKMKLI